MSDSSNLPNMMSKHGMKFRLVVGKIVEKDPHGRPTKMELLYDEQKTRVQGGEEFATIYVPAVLVPTVVLS